MGFQKTLLRFEMSC